MTNNRGSECRKWDLHIHTPISLCSEYGGQTDEIWRKYFEELERLSNEKHLKVIGINDYLFIDGYEKVLEYKKNGGLKNVELILPVIEFRLKEFVGSRELGRLNYHIIFANEDALQLQQIKTHFLSGLIGKGNLDIENPEGYTWGGVITKDSLIELGNHIIESTPKDKRTSMSPLDTGFNNINFEHSKILDLLGEGAEPNTFLKNKYLKAIGKAEWEDFRWDSSPLEKKSIINSTHFVFSASSTVEQAIKGKGALKNQGVNSRLLHCSDAHNFAEDCNKTKPKELGHCFNWIKAHPTFEGLKQIIYEYDERVIIQKEEPESEKLDNLLIDKISFNCSDNKFTQEPIRFNKNLNVIIGGKSSGKSILLYMIAKTLYNKIDDEILQYKDPDDGKIKDLYNLNKDNNDFDFKVTLFSGIEESLSQRKNGKSSILPDIKYFPQNYLSNLVDKSRKNGKTLKSLIRNLILEKPISKQSYDKFIEHLKKNDARREQEIDYYFLLKDEIKSKKDEQNKKGDIEALKKGIDISQEKIKQLSGKFTKEDSEKYNNLISEKNELIIKENNIESDYKKIKEFNEDIKTSLTELISKKQLLISSLKNDSLVKEYNDKYKFIDEYRENIRQIYNELEIDENNNFINENKIRRLLETIETDKEKNERELKPYVSKLENVNQIEALQKSVSEDMAKLNEIEQLKGEIKAKEEIYNQLKEKIFSDYEENYKEYNKILSILNSRIEEIEEDDDKIKIIGDIKYNFPRFRNEINNISDGRSFNNQNFEYLYQYENEKPKTALENIDFNKIKESLITVFDKIENNQFVLKKVSQKEACKIILRDYFFDHWDVISDNDNIHNMSTGKASLVLLKIIIKLSENKGPILIDQPEDDLDNRSISKELVEYLKLKKKERQIILVTHNPNIVVNADAENIIVANQKGQNGDEEESQYQFDYVNGALEDTKPKNEKEKNLLQSMGIREHIAEIVEGGKEAFKKREEKYGFK
ncbi:hypothetical protein ETU10_10565 [Apibacter muscae]|uniref:TrlF family AAA-like ATPase n=1 Tax=Apibacter muscae TaxID=2509004 RepID=UPI0011AD7CA8|nr:hypothetical protein [Apibacter muscae]TWP22509.1 hypothetical protein ETU10_10565 [Apibacter muscae]